MNPNDMNPEEFNQEEDFLAEINREADEKAIAKLAHRNACNYAYTCIQDQGFEQWFNDYAYQTTCKSLHQSKINVLENLIKFFIENNEQYEKCAYLQTNLDKCLANKKANIDDTPDTSNEFYDWRAADCTFPAGSSDA